MRSNLCVTQRGATLVELVVSIVVISIGLAGILIVMDRTTRSSGDALVEHQAIAVAEAYLEEILAKPFCDPDNAVPCATGNAPGTPNCQICPPGSPQEASRDLYDNICDYNGLNNNPPQDQTGTAFAALAAYTAQVGVSTGGTLGTGGTQLSGASCEVLTVTVTVTGPAGTNVTLVGHRTNY